jgi:multidrug resistance efflux pump
MDSSAAIRAAAAESKSPPKENLRQRVQSLRLPEDHELYRSRKRWLVWLVVLVALAAGGWAAYKYLILGDTATTSGAKAAPSTSSSPGTAPSTTASSSAANASGMQAAAPPSVASSGDIAHESKGYIIPAHQILISPKVPGMITALNIVEGQRVNKGDVLAQLETIDYQADYDRALAAVASADQHLLELKNGSRKEEIAEAQAELQEAEAQRNQLQAEWQRISQLRKSGVSTQGEYDVAEANYKAIDRRVERLKKAYELLVAGPRQERIDAAAADLELAKAEAAKAKWRLENCTIRAPISGTILTKKAEEGNVVNPIVMNGSYSLCEMADLSDLEVELKIQERDIAKIFKGQKCKVRAEAYPERVYDGVVSRLMPIADRSQGAVPVRVKIKVPAEEEGVYLKPEMGAIVSFLKAGESAQSQR